VLILGLSRCREGPPSRAVSISTEQGKVEGGEGRLIGKVVGPEVAADLLQASGRLRVPPKAGRHLRLQPAAANRLQLVARTVRTEVSCRDPSVRRLALPQNQDKPDEEGFHGKRHAFW
jgi:hypothetical protein